MENVILDDSPLAEFLEGMSFLAINYPATSSDNYARRRKRSRFNTTITRYIVAGQARLCAARAVNTPVENKGQAPTTTANT